MNLEPQRGSPINSRGVTEARGKPRYPCPMKLEPWRGSPMRPAPCLASAMQFCIYCLHCFEQSEGQQHAKEPKRPDECARKFEAKRSVQSGVALCFPPHSRSQGWLDEQRDETTWNRCCPPERPGLSGTMRRGHSSALSTPACFLQARSYFTRKDDADTRPIEQNCRPLATGAENQRPLRVISVDIQASYRP